ERIRHQQAIRADELPPARERLGMMLDAQKFFFDAGYVSIGMDHFALPGDELAAARREHRVWRNFMGYTSARGMELLGLGCSAISEFDDLFAQHVVPPEPYAQKLTEGTWAVQRGHRLDHDDLVRKHIINHLMCNLDVRIPQELVHGHDDLADSLMEAMQSLHPYVADGLLIERDDGYTITPLGQIFVRNLAMPFDR
ncbi:MAG: coproporphyrinogen III oxidase, partial [bacterium]|nr:coproporphyrinogen III oxidase [bacterium]